MAELDDEDAIGVQLEQDLAPDPLHLVDLASYKQLLELLAATVTRDDLHRVRSGSDLDIFDAPTDDLLLEIAPKHLDLN
jgi:hypothetical protein